MTAYMIAQIEIHDPAEYQHYLAGFMPIFERHGGRLLATSKNRLERIEGDWPLSGVVVMAFPSMAAAHEWHADPDYQALAEIRKRAATANIALVEGIG